MNKKLLYSILFFLFIASHDSFGQAACFTVQKTGCNSVQLTDCSGSTVILYNYGDGSGNTTSSTHTYNSIGIYTIKQTIPLSSSVDVTTTTITIVAPRQPEFNLDICEGRNITLNVTDTIDTDYNVDLGDGSSIVTTQTNNILSHTYSDITGKTITITPVTCGSPVQKTFYPLDNIVKPDISSLTVNKQHSTTGQIGIKFRALINQRYYLQQSVNNNTGYITVDTLENKSSIDTITINNLNTQSNQYCFRLMSFDDCGNPPETSEEICSSINNTVQADATNSEIDISWTPYLLGNVTNYKIYRTDNTSSPITTTNSTSYSDNNVNCGVNYCYYIVAELNQLDELGNNLKSITDTLCAIAASDNIPTAIQNINSSITGNSVNLSWDTPIGFSVAKYKVLRSINGSVYTIYAHPSVNNFTDNNITTPGNTYCYKIDYEDICGNPSSSGGTTCPIILDVTIDNTDNMINHLIWSAYSGASPITAYIVEILDQNNNIVITFNNGLSTSFTHNTTNLNLQSVKYRINISLSGITYYSNISEIKYEGEIYLPNAFTPDEDNVNDVFMAKGKFTKEFKLTIFNRWGEVVYTSNNINEGWNGTYNNNTAPNDTYAYLVEAVDFWGKKINKKGSITLLR